MHHSTILTSEDAETCDGIPLTAVPRTLLDLFAGPRIKVAEGALQRSERLGLLDLGAVDALLARSGRHLGRKSLVGALSLYRDPSFARSWLERRLLQLVTTAGLPRPSLNAFVAGYEVDAYWERERFAVELDGYEFHRDRASFERDRRRQEDLKLAGIEMVRFTARRIADHPDDVVRRIDALLRRRRSELPTARSTAGTG